MRTFILILLTAWLLASCGITKKYEEAKASRSISLYEDYIANYPNSKHFNSAKEELNSLYEDRDWKWANQYNTETAFEEFLKHHPHSKNASQAEDRIKEIQERDAWSKTTSINTIYSYENFLSTYPDSRYSFDARNEIVKLKEGLAWKEAENKSTVDSYRKYISDFPNGSRKALALDRVKEIEIILPAWNGAEKTNTPAAYRDFLYQYPNSSYTSRANDRLSALERDYWYQANNAKSIELYQKYLVNFPFGEHLAEAEKAIIDVEVDDIFKGDHGQLPPMNKTSDGYSYATTNEIEIYNNTGYTLTVRYSGNFESKKIVLKSKEKQTFELGNGDYRVTASVDAVNVTNYAGKEKLEGGGYTSEFYIETRRY